MVSTSLWPRPCESVKALVLPCLACVWFCRFEMPRKLLYTRNALQQVLEAIWQEPRVDLVVYNYTASGFDSTLV
jgi:hypothetical protein